MMAPPVDRIQRRYSLDEIRYSPSVRQLMPSIDLDTIVFETGSWESRRTRLRSCRRRRRPQPGHQANPRECSDRGPHRRGGSDVDNLAVGSPRGSAATLLTQQFNVPAENLTSQGWRAVSEGGPTGRA
jgi:hypothetical protein